MPVIALAQEDGKENSPRRGVLEAIRAVLEIRYPEYALVREAEYVEDVERLRQILQLAKIASLADIQTAIEAAASPLR